LEQSLGRQPTVADISGYMKLPEKEISECLQLAGHPVSLNQPAGKDEDGNLENCIPDTEAESADGAALKSILTKSMESLLDTLDEREQMVLRLYYGIGVQNTLTLNEIADRFEVTRERVRQIKVKALQKLRHPSRIKQLTAFRG
jgi:RNA polymerase primary sigma factor